MIPGWLVVVLIFLTLIVVSRMAKPRPRGDADAAVLAQLSAHGADLTKSRVIEFFMWMPDEDKANQAAARCQVLGFEAQVAPPPEGFQSWSCNVSKTMIPELAAIKDVAMNLTRIASDLGGQYDGWGTPVGE